MCNFRFVLEWKKFFKRVKKAHTWEVPQRDTEEQKAIEEEDDELMRKKLAETLLNGNESKWYFLSFTFLFFALNLREKSNFYSPN